MASQANDRGTTGESSSGPSSAAVSRRNSTNTGNSKKSSSKQPVRIGQYTLQQTLGTGSFGKVKCGF
jgi:carbon catabolite-derepressing protein kinase